MKPQYLSMITAALLATGLVGEAAASSVLVTQSTQSNDRYIPAIWVDPDGCQHWVMDDGAEGYMSPVLTRDGRPVCEGGNICMTAQADQLFAVDKHYISPEARQRLREFFQNSQARAFAIEGHTDSDASDAYNMALSQRRAEAVAAIARELGLSVETRAYGERVPVASNATREGKAQNRRVEIRCIQ